MSRVTLAQSQPWVLQVSDMLGNVLKMASENKITAKNTWSLQLIDHLSDLVKSGEERTNFQRASCTLDAVRTPHRWFGRFSQRLQCHVVCRTAESKGGTLPPTKSFPRRTCQRAHGLPV